MSTLKTPERKLLEKYFEMQSGYVLKFSDTTFEIFFKENFGVDIHTKAYEIFGTSKANKMRAFWHLESDATVGKLIVELINNRNDDEHFEKNEILEEKCQNIAQQLLKSRTDLDPLRATATNMNAAHLKEQIERMQNAIDSDPSLAVGTAKELAETVCRTILSERGQTVEGTLKISELTKKVVSEMGLVPNSIQDSAKGSDVIKKILGNLGTITQGLAELRNLYGTGHGKHGSAQPIKPRHARLAVGAAATFSNFLWETHEEQKQNR